MAENIDKENMIKVLDNFWKQCEEASMLGNDIKVSFPINGIIFCGMGGSAIPGDIIKSYIELSYPVEIVRDYKIPAWADKNTLVFIASYSGNTEEALSCFKSAKAKGTKIVCITSGGKLKKFCEDSKTPLIIVPSGIQPRDAIGYQTLPLLNVLINSKIISSTAKDDIKDMVGLLRKDIKEEAEALAKKLVNKIPLIYSSDRMVSVARAWKTKINENAKAQAFFNVFPEMNHNEMVGFTNLKADYYAIFIDDKDDHPRIKKRMEITKKLLNEKRCPVLILKLTGPNRLARIFSCILLGSYVGYYLALEYGTDPTPVKMVEDLKKELGEYIK
ncbi:MAG: bifunctional phosphoglucose/phosphomannose isomerase [Candidatus Woesearchaeota archaeon]|nr:bifunctional phosphoglucose/phosphomannose isomerase [Candidatus Woesearchaeota archaeon]